MIVSTGVQYTVLDVTGLGESDDGNIRQAGVTSGTRPAGQHCTAVSTGLDLTQLISASVVIDVVQ